jgi:phospholipase/carboxylesterase
LIAGFIDELILNYSIDAKAVSLLFSQGAILSYAIALSHPEKISKVIALSGYLNEELSKKIIGITISQTNIFASHGVVDQVIPVTWARKQHPFGRIRNRIYLQRIPIGHGISPQILLISKLVVKKKKVPNFGTFFFDKVKSDLLQKKYYRHCLRNI